MRYKIWKRRKKRFAKGGIEPESITSKVVLERDLPSEPLKLIQWADTSTLPFYFWCPLYILIDRYLVQSAVSNLFPNQTAVSNYTYLFRFVWFVIVFSDLL